MLDVRSGPGCALCGGGRLLTALQVARVLSLSVRTVWRLSSTGELPRPVRLGGSTRWRRGDIEAALAAGGPSAEQLPSGPLKRRHALGIQPIPLARRPSCGTD